MLILDLVLVSIPIIRDPETNLSAVYFEKDTSADVNFIQDKDIIVIHQIGDDVNDFEVSG